MKVDSLYILPYLNIYRALLLRIEQCKKEKSIHRLHVFTAIFEKILLLTFSLLGTLFPLTMKLLSLNVTAVNTTTFSKHYSVWVSPKMKTNHTLYFSHVLWDHFRSLWGQEAGSALIALLVCYSLDVCKNPM